MSKLTKIEKTARRDLLVVLSELGGGIFSAPFLGVTVVVVPATSYTLFMKEGHITSPAQGHDEFVRVAVAVCSDSDTFKRKRGELIALQRMLDGETIPVRRNVLTFDEVAAIVAETVN